MRHLFLTLNIFLIIVTLTTPTWADEVTQQQHKNLCSTNSDCKTCLDKDGKEDLTKKPTCVQKTMSCICKDKKTNKNNSSTDANLIVTIPAGSN